MTVAALAAACSPASPAKEPIAGPGANQGLREIPLVIQSDGKSHRFTVEVADSPSEQQTGMMYRYSLATDRGMLFPYSPPRPVSFWMLNTYIPLDMVFIRADGTISQIVTATPHELDLVVSYEPVVAVVEIGGGRAGQLGIREGDRVSFTL